MPLASMKAPAIDAVCACTVEAPAADERRHAWTFHAQLKCRRPAAWCARDLDFGGAIEEGAERAERVSVLDTETAF
jgi:hypothetical protein